ncbi:unnamed protein product [Angiostrongylus costaricensis]|uniref:H15 domain-containing protein n=1 Tax=Angiostrongylus costaricensis TaxID=334426 RepID=A0A0R3PFR8_ANGCS|nr:unnamed protein product [Angiostrongylus costaricensis]
MDMQVAREDNSKESNITRCSVHQKKIDTKEPGIEKVFNKNSEPEKLKGKEVRDFLRRRKQSVRDRPLAKLAGDLKNEWEKREDNGIECKKKREKRVRWADQLTSHHSGNIEAKGKSVTGSPTTVAEVSKPKKAKEASFHPTYPSMIRKMVSKLKVSESGSSRAAILKFMMSRCNLADYFTKINSHLRIALKNPVMNGELKQIKGIGASASFRLGKKKSVSATKKVGGGRSAHFVPHFSDGIVSKNLKVPGSKTKKIKA